MEISATLSLEQQFKLQVLREEVKKLEPRTSSRLSHRGFPSNDG